MFSTLAEKSDDAHGMQLTDVLEQVKIIIMDLKQGHIVNTKEYSIDEYPATIDILISTLLFFAKLNDGSVQNMIKKTKLPVQWIENFYAAMADTGWAMILLLAT